MDIIKNYNFNKDLMCDLNDSIDLNKYEIFDFEKILHIGIDAYLVLVDDFIENGIDIEFNDKLRNTIKELQNFIIKNKNNHPKIENIIKYGASTLEEALIFLRFLMVFSHNYNLNRLDYYLNPYLKKDLLAFNINLEKAKNLIDQFLFFCNQLDEKVSITLGGANIFERSIINDVTKTVLEYGNNMNNLEINVRVRDDFPNSLLHYGNINYFNDNHVLASIKGSYSFNLNDLLNYHIVKDNKIITSKIFPKSDKEAPYRSKKVI